MAASITVRIYDLGVYGRAREYMNSERHAMKADKQA